MIKEKIKKQIYEIENQYPNLHIDLHRDQFGYSGSGNLKILDF